jgi:hypothetical protein
MRVHLPAFDHGFMDPAPVPYAIRIHGHLGAIEMLGDLHEYGALGRAVTKPEALAAV